MRAPDMNCLAVERLLDEGMPQALRAAALTHTHECARCARSLARARSLERALERHFTSEPAAADAVPAGFTDRVMIRVERGEARGIRGIALPAALPWWVGAAREPAVLLAFVLTAFVAWRGEILLTLTRDGLPVASQVVRDGLAAASRAIGLDGLARALAEVSTSGGVVPYAAPAALFLGVLPVLALVAFASWRAGERIARLAGAPAPWPLARPSAIFREPGAA